MAVVKEGSAPFPKMEWPLCDSWIALVQNFLDLKPFSASNTAGVQQALSLFAREVEERGFTAQRFANVNVNGADVLVATRAPRGARHASWIGLFGHVDVEVVIDAERWCVADPMRATLKDGRWYARGIADNLGPLLARVVSFSSDDVDCAGVVWVIHGEEEVGSPFAHQLYPALRGRVPELSLVRLWLEETGYFRRDGSQRVLVLHSAADATLVDVLLCRLRALAADRAVHVEERALNKAFGLDKCPCLTHLLDGSVPYLSIGINDSHSNIHNIDESVPAAVLALAHEQFEAVKRVI